MKRDCDKGRAEHEHASNNDSNWYRLGWFSFGFLVAVYSWIPASHAIPIIDAHIPPWLRAMLPSGKTSWGEAFLVGLTALFLLAAIAQWRATAKAVRLTGAALVETRRSTEHARDREQRELRAYVGFKAGNMNIEDPALPPVATVTIENFGLTPAINVVHRLRAEFGLIINYLSSPSIVSSPSDARSVLFPRTSSTGFASLLQALPPEQIGWLHNGGNWAVHVYGEIEYVDVFGKQRATHYHMMSQASSGKENLLFFCSGGNDAT